MSVVEEIKDRLDVVEVISAYVPLQKAGRNYKGLCPFHQEKTPSFVVFPDSGTWRCFGACGTGGDVFAFVMKRENVDFREALELLAPKAGIDLAPPSQARSQQDQYLDRLREINQAAAVYFHNLLRQSAQAEGARGYLAGRGLDDTIIDRFQLGYAAESWDALLNHLRGRNYEVADILAAGLVVEKVYDDGRTSHYDRFRDRIVVPIRDLRGRTIGFGARALAADQQPKYLNTPQSPLFDKSSVLFGLDQARRAIRAREQAIIVEGYMDVLAAHQFGETNVVASMGTALTEQQLRQLKRYTRTFILALDADTAGQAATLRGITQAREALDRDLVPTLTASGLVRHETRLAAELRIMTLPEGHDPDDVIRSDPARWQTLVDAAQPVVDYYFDLVQAELDLESAQGKSEAVDRLAPLIREVADEIQRIHYVQRLARLIQTDERTVERLILARSRASRRPQAPPEPPPAAWEDADEDELADGFFGTAEMAADAGGGRTPAPVTPLLPGPATHCLALLAMQPELLPQLQTELTDLAAGPLDEDDFGRAEERAICAALLAGRVGTGGQWPEAEPALQPLLVQLRQYGQEQPELARPQMSRELVNSVLRLRIANLKARTRQLPSLVREAEAAGQLEDARQYRQLLRDLGQHRLLLEQKLSARTYSGQRRILPSYRVINEQDG